jgi:streptogramin lyase
MKERKLGICLGAASVAVMLVATGALRSADETPSPAYRVVENWAQLPPGRTWGEVSSISIDSSGNVWAFDRCGADTCVGRSEDPVLEFDPTGKLVKSFGAGMFAFPHGLFVDNDNNVWTVDADGKDGKGHQVTKFSPEGKVLLRLGKPGVAGYGPDTFNRPAAVVVAPNGDIFVADGHGPNGGPFANDHGLDPNPRIVKFSKTGKFIKSWGRKGSLPGEFGEPHAIAMDSKGRILVGDRGNRRIQIFDANGVYLEEWHFDRPSGIFIDKRERIYVVDDSARTGGIRLVNAQTGLASFFIPDAGLQAAVGVAADSSGNLYGAEIRRRTILKFVKQ